MRNRLQAVLLLVASSMVAAAAGQAQPAAGRPDMETLTLGGGCFWCIEAVFEELEGVTRVESGYSGGGVANPDYEAVSSGRTGHAEVVQVTFNPAVLSISDLLDVFFAMHDPTTLNRQGADIGTQYRSVIFFRTPAQEKAARESMARVEASKAYSNPVVTQIEPFQAFYLAEDYHQEYYRLHGSAPYCRFVISPKMEKLRKTFGTKLRR